MIIQNDAESKLTSVWVANNERESVQAKIEAITKENKAKKFKTVVFYSGSQSLYDNTENLIMKNR